MALAESQDIVVEFEGNFDLDGVTDKQLQLIGIDTDEPILRIESKFYKLDVRDFVGTRLVFKTGEETGKVEYLTKTPKMITARRVMVKPK